MISVLDCGWSWQIPLPNVLSVGVVLDKTIAKNYGSTPTERLETVIAQNTLLAHAGRYRQRVSPVKTYSNYQLISKRAYGAGWALVGDAFGFVDPMLSPGVFMALHSAERLAKALTKCVFQPVSSLGKRFIPTSQPLENYGQALMRWHRSWQEIIEYFYDGRLLSLHESSKALMTETGFKFSPQKLMHRHITRVLAAMVSGAGTCSGYHKRLLAYSCQHMVKDDALTDSLAIKRSLCDKKLSNAEESVAALRQFEACPNAKANQRVAGQS